LLLVRTWKKTVMNTGEGTYGAAVLCRMGLKTDV
jgi:hypothetical protein